MTASAFTTKAKDFALAKLRLLESPVRWALGGLFILTVFYAILWWASAPFAWVITMWSYVTYLALAIGILQMACFLALPRGAVGRDLMFFFFLYVVLLSSFSTWYYQLHADFDLPDPIDGTAMTERLAQIHRLESEDWYTRAEQDYQRLVGFWMTLFASSNIGATMGPLSCPGPEAPGRPIGIDCSGISKRNDLLAEGARLRNDSQRSNFLYYLHAASHYATSLKPRTSRATLLVIFQRLALVFVLTLYLTALTKGGRST